MLQQLLVPIPLISVPNPAYVSQCIDRFVESLHEPVQLRRQLPIPTDMLYRSTATTDAVIPVHTANMLTDLCSTFKDLCLVVRTEQGRQLLTEYFDAQSLWRIGSFLNADD